MVHAHAAAQQLATRLTEAADDWPAAVPINAQILTRDDEYERDAVQLADGAVLYRVEWGGPEGIDPASTWHVQGWSNASAARRHRPIPLSHIRAGATPRAPHDGDHLGWS